MYVSGQQPEDTPGAAPPVPVPPAPGSPGLTVSAAGEAVGVPSTVAEALAMARAALGWLAGADLAGVPVAVQADCLRQLEGVGSMHAAAQARTAGAFTASRGFEADGQYSARTWLRWQNRTTSSAAGQVVAMARRLAAHQAVAAALAAGDLSVSWARAICDWTDELPEDARDDADAILLAAAQGGADLPDLADLADQIRRRLARPDRDKDQFDDRWLRLGVTFRGAGRLDAGLTPRCAAALAAVLESLGKHAGPEDTRTKAQRDHDALEEACRRLLASGCLPDRAGQPVQLQLHLTLDQLLGRTSTAGSDPAAARSAGGGAASGRPCCAQPAAAPGDECDATITPIVTGRVDHDLLDRLAAILTGRTGRTGLTGQTGAPGTSAPGTDLPGIGVPGIGVPGIGVPGISVPGTGVPGTGVPGTGVPGTGVPGTGVPGTGVPGTGLPGTGICAGPHLCRPDGHPAGIHAGDAGQDGEDGAGRWQAISRDSARSLILHEAIGLLSGPDALTSYLRTGRLTGPAASISLPLDVGTATDTIPARLRRAVIARDKHCRFPGCRQRPAACQIHHLVPRVKGGRTSLAGMALFCAFHHLIAIHRWGWQVTLNPDGTTTATSPDGLRAYHSHSPPGKAA